MASSPTFKPYRRPAGGWGSVRSLFRFGTGRHVPELEAVRQLRRHNKADGYMCVSCAWAKPKDPHRFEFCENGAKATFWELDQGRVGADFFASHTVSELLQWPDFDLERRGRLTEPLRYDHDSDRYVPIRWDEAFALIGRELRALDPESVVFYTSGRASNEASYMYALLARLYGNNNLPDSSNMCHESTSVGLPRSIGVPVGTVRLEDFEETDCILSFGQNVGTNSPRMLHQLQEASERGVPILTFNPQEPVPMVTGSSTRISSDYYQVKAGGDLALLQGLCKALLEADDAALRDGRERILDTAFIAEHTHGFDAFAASLRATGWDEIEHESGLARERLDQAASVYARARSCMLLYGMGMTQHHRGVDNVRMLCNLMLMRGNIGRKGAGICPVRGHSNVQGQRTVGVTEKTELAPIDKLKELYRFEPPCKNGLDTVEAVKGVIDGSVRAFVGLGGNFVRAAPDTRRLEQAWRRLRLTVQVATKLNRSHLVRGQVALLLPCLGRLERDRQASGDQIVTMEDSTACIHASFGTHEPASPDLMSEPAIIAGIAQATLERGEVPWREWVADYGKVREAIEATYPDDFKDYSRRMRQPGGFPRPLAARERRWSTESGKAEFFVPEILNGTGFEDAEHRLRLITLRSNDQFNTTIYGYRDRFRGIEGTRRVVLMCKRDIERLRLQEGQLVDLLSDHEDGIEREVGGLRVVSYDVPPGCIVGYYPECNPLLSVEHHAIDSHVPATKSIPVRVRGESRAQAPAGPAPV
ncbi:FdhF/YdeP family oxidoreductase [Luteimonas suaedae]|uniref:FdhF/YdeP family oxidoreductase n=1 Tax=Luteimonas suaedae TaxID=2605430 RepID=UPI0011ED9958|nr:FdhF/YdeP family oxidoreductase [Luteimonas suaedae]